MPKVSIIVPVYNTEKYLAQCLDSIINQSLKDIEILCVDDGSTDSSPEILKEYAKKDSRIRIIQKPNAGYGNSMNLGIKELTGEYFGLVDSDDCIASNMYEVLYKEATTHDLDFVRSDHYRWYPERDSKKLIYCYATSGLYNVVKRPMDSDDLFVRVVTCTGLYKTSFIRENQIQYNETPGAAFQDQGFWFQTTALANRMMFVNQAFYYYRFDNENSSINSYKVISTMNAEYELNKQIAKKHEDKHEKIIAFYWRARFAMTLFSCRQMGEDVTPEAVKPFCDSFAKASQSGELDTSFFTEDQLLALSYAVSGPEKFSKMQKGNLKWNALLCKCKHRPGPLRKIFFHLRAFGVKLTIDKLLGRM